MVLIEDLKHGSLKPRSYGLPSDGDRGPAVGEVEVEAALRNFRFLS